MLLSSGEVYFLPLLKAPWAHIQAELPVEAEALGLRRPEKRDEPGPKRLLLGFLSSTRPSVSESTVIPAWVTVPPKQGADASESSCQNIFI